MKQKGLMNLIIYTFIISSFGFSAAPMPSATSTPTPGGYLSILDYPVTNGAVFAITVTATDVYIGGYFSMIGPRTGCGVPVDMVTGAVTPGFPQLTGYVNGDITSVVSDNNGGWFVSGTLRYVAGMPRMGVAHIYSNGSLDPDFNLNLTVSSGDVIIDAIAFDGTNLYVRGSFDHLNGAVVNNFVRVNVSTLVVDASFTPPSVGIRKIVLNGGYIYICGGSSSGPYRYLCRLNASDGTLDSTFIPQPNATVYDLAIAGPNIYIAGSFSSVSLTARNRVAKIDSITGAVDPVFNSNVDSNVTAIVYAGASIYIGGSFYTVNGISATGFAKIDSVTGALDTGFVSPVSRHVLYPEGGFGVLSLAYDGVSVYLGGDFNSVSGQLRNCAAKVNAVTGALDAQFNPSANGKVQALCYDGSRLFAAGEFSSLGSINRRQVAKINSATRRVDESFDARINYVFNQMVKALAYDGTGLYIGGSFNSVNGTARNNIAKVSLIDGTLDSSFNPNTDGGVKDIKPVGSDVFIAGGFTYVKSTLRNRVAKVNQITGALDAAFNPNPNSFVYGVESDGSNVYICGNFGTVGGITRNRTAKVDYITGAVDMAFSADANSDVNDIEILGSSLYAGGYFSSIGGVPRVSIARLDQATGMPDPSFIPNTLSGSVESISIRSGSVYFGGLIGNLLSITGSWDFAAKEDAITGAIDNGFYLNTYGQIEKVQASPYEDILFTGGNQIVAGMPVTGFGAFYLGNAPTPTPTASFTKSPTATRTSTASRTIIPTKTMTSTRSETKTETPVYSPTDSGTQTATSTISQTHTVSPTGTESYTFTQTGTITETNTQTSTMTITQTDTITPTNTETESPTQTMTYTSTYTLTTTSTSTFTGTITYTPSVTPTCSQTYTATQTCTDTPVFTPTPIPNMHVQTEPVVVYPNPAKDTLQVWFKEDRGAQVVELSLYTRGLRLIKKQTLALNGLNIYTLDVSGFSNGIYVLVARQIKNGVVVYRKVTTIELLR